ncbi:MAG: hypothetical protein PSX36_07655 [bacterium]|nr:hypothetical protein [bacterium]
MKTHSLSLLFIFFSLFARAQDLSPKEIHDQATDNISGVLFDSKSKPIQDRIKQFENSFGVKLHFRVDDQSLDKLGGLSEHLFKLFQTFTSPLNTNVKTITGEFSALDDEVLSNILTYKTFATSDLRNCTLPLPATEAMDSLYNRSLHKELLSAEDRGKVPESLDGIYVQAAHDYESIFSKNSTCPNVFGFDANAYTQHVLNTRQNRANNWASAITFLSTQLSYRFGQLNSAQPEPTPGNSGSTGVNMNIDPHALVGEHFINLNNSVNTCTQKDLEIRCRMLQKATGIRFMFVTQTLNFYIPLDSLTLFRNAVTYSLETQYADKNIIVALYLKMEDPTTGEPALTLQVKQNGTWLSNADIAFATYNNAGGYKGGLLYKFTNLYKNIPKPLILCYQLAKVNGLLTTAYFKKGEHIKGREQIYFHILKLDKAFDELKILDERMSQLLLEAGQKEYIPAPLQKQIDDQRDKIKIAYVKASLQPEFNEAKEHFKDVHLQKKEIAHAAALKYLKDNYGMMYSGNKISSLIDNIGLPTDLTIGSCETPDNSDVIADLLNVSSLLLSPAGLDFVPDALLVAYYLNDGKAIDALKASGNFFIPGVLCGAKKVILTCVDAIRELNAGSKLVVELNVVKAIPCDNANLASALNLDPSAMGPIMGDLNGNPAAVKQMLPVTAAQGKIYQNTEKLSPAKQIEFTKKCLDDADFRHKCLADPEEVLRWGGVLDEFSKLLTKQKKRIENLSTEFGELNFAGFHPVNGKASTDITSMMYNEMYAELGSRPNYTTQDKVEKISEILGSGSTIPQKVSYPEGIELFKVVKKGRTPSPTTEYWLTKADFELLTSKGSNFESKTGLPLGSFSEEYDIFKITSNSNSTVYRSTVAPTIQSGYQNAGGATQTIVLNRNSWSNPIKINDISYIPNF